MDGQLFSPTFLSFPSPLFPFGFFLLSIGQSFFLFVYAYMVLTYPTARTLFILRDSTPAWIATRYFTQIYIFLAAF